VLLTASTDYCYQFFLFGIPEVLQMDINEQLLERKRRYEQHRQGSSDNSASSQHMDVDELNLSAGGDTGRNLSSTDNQQTSNKRQIEELQNEMTTLNKSLDSVRKTRDEFQNQIEKMNEQIRTMERQLDTKKAQLNALLNPDTVTTVTSSAPVISTSTSPTTRVDPSVLDAEYAAQLQEQERREAQREQDEAQHEQRQQVGNPLLLQPDPISDLLGQFGSGIGGTDVFSSTGRRHQQIMSLFNNNGMQTVFSSRTGGDDDTFDSMLNNPFGMRFPGLMLPLGELINAQMGGPQPASNDYIESLPTDTFKSKPGSSSSGGASAPVTEEKVIDNTEDEDQQDADPDKKCCICLDQFKDGDSIRRLPCLHIFHKDEIDHWLRTNHVCPICRTPIEGSSRSNN